ncbi:MAG: VCBS domain-containing protein [Thiobacillus sp.]|nr:VCBS domain-containing protein [Thiobacillus sp.]
MGSAHNEFVAGSSYTDSITVATADGSTQLITVTLTGTDDATVIAGTSTAAITESNAIQSASGTLTATDPDSSADFVALNNVAGSNGYGVFSINAAGAWTYTMGSAHNEFVAGSSYTDSITVATADGSTQLITVTLTGTDDAPSFGTASKTANISEEGLPNGVPDTTGTPTDTTNALVSSGTFAITDIDGPALSVTLTAPSTALTSGGQAITWSGSGTSTLTASAGSNVIMTISITNTGAYTVTLSGPIDHATAGAEDIASLGITVTASDGTLTTTGTLTVNVEDDAPLAGNDFATLTMGSNTAGNVSTNDLGAELPGTVESVVYQGTTYTAVGGVITVDTGKGILSMNQDGSYTYESSLFTTLGGSNGLADWSNVSITAFNGARNVASQNEFFIDPTTYVPLAANILSITGTGVLTVLDGTLADGTDGLGIAGGSGSATYLNGHPSSPEALMVNLGNEVLSLNANFYSGTNSGVPFYWAAYDGSGNLVGTGSGAVAKPGFTLDVDTGGTPFQYVALYGVDTSASTKILLTGFDSIQYADTSPDEFTYNIVDADGDASSARLAISQTAPSNTAPVAADDGYTTAEDTALTLNVLGNDSDPDGDPLLLWGYTQATNGAVTTDAGGNLVYTPNANWSGTDTFTYTIRDSNGGIDTASVSVVVTPVADAPQLFAPAELDALVAGASTANTTSGTSQSNLAAAIGFTSSTLDSFNPPPGPGTNDSGTVDVQDGGLTNYTYTLPAGMSVVFDWTFINGENLASEINDGYNDLVVLVVTNPNGTQTSTLITSAEQAGPANNTSGAYTFTAPTAGGYQFSWLVLNARDTGKDSSIAISNISFRNGATTFGTPIALPISTAMVDTDGSETLSVTIAGVPAGAAFNAGTNLGGGVWSFTPAQLEGLTFLPADGYTGTLNLTVTSTATEAGNGSTASTTQNIAVTVSETTNTMTGTSGGTTMTGTANNDHIQGLAGNDTLNGGDGNDLIVGGMGNDTLNGGNNNDWLVGGAGTDTLNGGSGNDTLIGGTGNDTLTGGLGADVFRWELADAGTVATPAVDTVTDFDTVDNSDKLDLRDLLQGESHAGADAGNLADYLHFSYNAGTGTTVLEVKSQGAAMAGPDQIINLSGVDLVTGYTSDQQIIQDLLSKGKLITD